MERSPHARKKNFGFSIAATVAMLCGLLSLSRSPLGWAIDIPTIPILYDKEDSQILLEFLAGTNGTTTAQRKILDEKLGRSAIWCVHCLKTGAANRRELTFCFAGKSRNSSRVYSVTFPVTRDPKGGTTAEAPRFGFHDRKAAGGDAPAIPSAESLKILTDALRNTEVTARIEEFLKEEGNGIRYLRIQPASSMEKGSLELDTRIDPTPSAAALRWEVSGSDASYTFVVKSE